MASPILERYEIVAMEEENGYATRPTTPFTNDFYIRPINFEVLNPQNRITVEHADGGRIAARNVIVSQQITWILELETHPKLIGWFLKWGLGAMSNPATSQYQINPVERYVEQPSFTIYADTQEADFWAAGEQTAYILGNKISLLRMESNGRPDNNDHRVMVRMEGIGQKPNVSAADVITGIAPLAYVKTQLFGSTDALPWMFKNSIAQWTAVGGYTSANEWQRWAIEITNELDPVTFADDNTDTYISDIRTLGQTIRCEFDRQLIDSALIHSAKNATERDVKLRVTHRTTYDGTNGYRMVFHMPRFVLDDAGPLMRSAGGTQPRSPTMTGTALQKEKVQAFTNTLTGTNHDLTIDGTNREAYKFQPTVNGWLTRCILQMRTDGSSNADNLTMHIFPDATDEPGAAVINGATSNAVSGEMLTTSYQSIEFFFPNKPYLQSANEYWIVMQSSGTDTVEVGGDVAGTSTHATSTDSGATWPGASDADQWDLEVEFDEVALVVDYFSEGTYPDAA